MKKGPAIKFKWGPYRFALAAATTPENLNPAEWLSIAEKKVCASFGSEKRREQFLLGRVAAKRSLQALEPHTVAKATTLLPGVLGQPIWPDLPWHSSISHSRSTALALTSSPGLPLTLDLEPVFVEPASRLSLLKKRLPPDEHFKGPTAAAAIIGAWSAKECLGKALCTGISVAPEVLALTRSKSGARLTYGYKAVPQFHCHQWSINGWIFSWLAPKELAPPPGLGAWLTAVLRRSDAKS